VKIKMIVTDLDGTLLKSDKSISEYTKSVLRKCRDLGIKVAYATGRGGSAKRVAPSELFDGQISMNGAVAKIGDEIVYKRLILHRTALPILTACDKHGIKITSENSGMHYSNFSVSDMWPQITNFKIVDFLQHNIDAEKIYTPNPTANDRLFIEQLLSDDLYFVVTTDGDGYLGQIMHKEATKAKAIAALAQHWGITRSEIAAFGDDYNDIDMLQECGISIAVANAINDVKAVAEYICDANDNDGIAKWIVDVLA